MTEEEAKIKFCANSQDRYCWGSNCMAWRWTQAKDTEAFLALVREKMGDGSNYQAVLSAALKEHRARFENTEGYCGLAGRL